MVARKPYHKPEIFRVALNAEQAILSACSLLAMNQMNGMMQWCRVNRCKNASSMNMADSGARPS